MTDSANTVDIRPAPASRTPGHVLRQWRRRRGLSQIALSVDAEVSTRHLSFVESGRAGASRDLLLRLAECLDMPLRERNHLLLAGGFAPGHGARDLADPEMAPIRETLDMILEGHRPFPALLVDRQWHLVQANEPAAELIAGISPALLQPPVNLMRVALHPEGLAPRILNFAEWRGHLLARLRAEILATADPALIALHDELAHLPGPRHKPAPHSAAAIAVPLVLKASDGQALTLLSTTTVFGTANDITLAELMLECFYPTDAATRDYFLSKALPG